MRNDFNMSLILNLLIQSDVWVWREKNTWIELFKFLIINDEICMIQMLYGITNFQTIVVKSYHAKQTLKTAWNKAILDNDKKEDEAKSSNKSKVKGLE